MQSIKQPDVSHSILAAGVDWITGTANTGSTRWSMQEFADHQKRRFMDAGEPIKSGYRLGYYGWQAGGFFHGQREGGSIVVASGAAAHDVHRSVIQVSDHISRIDLQVTVATPEERPHLARHAYSVIKSGSPCRIKVKNVTLIDSHPNGETCNVGKRKSDTYGRIYDKATEAGTGPARSVWRYEVEYKRSPANRIAADLTGNNTPQAVALSLVHRWFEARSVVPLFSPAALSCPQDAYKIPNKRDVLTWFEASLSITIAKAIRLYGLARVIEALGLQSRVELKPERRSLHGTRDRRPTPPDNHVLPSRRELP